MVCLDNREGKNKGNHPDNVRILLVGDGDTGKTSLILSLVSEEFPEHVPARAEEITIPPDVTPERVPTHIVDFSEREQSPEELRRELQAADVVCVVYSVEEEDTLDRITSHWLPLIRTTLGEDHDTPIILVGNKVDLVDYSTMEIVLDLMLEYPEIETCIECSARSLKNISELFYYAQKAVLHPIAPLYRLDERDLTEECKRALSRIFRLCDRDCDDILNDHELNVFQELCFQSPLMPQALDDLKAVVSRNCPDGVQGDGLTLRGFLFLHRLFVQRGRHETTWTVLRRFGYNGALTLPPEYLMPPLRVPPGCSTELNHAGYLFLTELFERHDRDKDGALSPAETVSLFATCPGVPWGPELCTTVTTNSAGYVTLAGFLAQWTLWTALDVQMALQHLAYLGFCVASPHASQLAAITVTREKSLDLAKRASVRSVYQCHVIGPPGVGKTTFCQGLLGRSLQEVQTLREDTVSRHTIATVQVYGQEKYLVLHDIDVHNITDALMPDEVACDVACLIYDVSSPTSFEYIARIYLKYFSESQIPVLVVGNKEDAGKVWQRYMTQPEQFCVQHKLPPPHPFSSARPKRDIYTKLATMAAYPRFQAAWMLFYKNRQLQQLRLAVYGEEGRWLKVGLGVAAAAAIVIVLSKVFRSSDPR
ncbi:mitochondrial Rho GTPase 1 [Hyalella azteca]|uniref:Mitochondrial Rho GTPase n=1 Tax=Hyalella azteca TaxID=294128 RepID=A0A979FLF4_HYAAZ|nr:mitochondrial Rho GTPase 1 [Hyalella azteca]